MLFRYFFKKIVYNIMKYWIAMLENLNLARVLFLCQDSVQKTTRYVESRDWFLYEIFNQSEANCL